MANGPDKIVLDALEAKGAFSECPVCDQNEWIVPGGPALIPTYESQGYPLVEGLPADSDDEATLDLHGVTVIPVACTNCGLTRLFYLTALLDKNDD